MKKLLLLFTVLWLAVPCLFAQVEPNAGKWKTWFISSGKEYKLPPPPDAAATKEELKKIVSVQKKNDSAAVQKILFWNAGAPGYRWREFFFQFTSREKIPDSISPLFISFLLNA